MVRKPSRSAPLICTIDFAGFSVVMLVVVFVVLTIGMTTPPPNYGMGPDLPKAYHPSTMERASREDAMVIAIARDGRVYFGHDELELEALPRLIRNELNIGTEQKVYLKVDRNARYDVVTRVLAEVHAANVQKVAFLVEKRLLLQIPPQNLIP